MNKIFTISALVLALSACNTDPVNESTGSGNSIGSVALSDEMFVGETITATVTDADGVVQEVDMVESNYDRSDQYMYFKAGVYNQNNTADKNDYVQATFTNSKIAILNSIIRDKRQIFHLLSLSLSY